MSTHDLVIAGATILTVDAADTVVRNGWIGVDAGRISEIGVGIAPPGSTRIDARGCVVHPGFINTHQHAMDALERSRVPARSDFWEWLFGRYYRSALALTPSDAARAAALTAEDLVAGGVTTTVELWGVGDLAADRAIDCFAATARAVARCGMRWIAAPMCADVIPAAWGAEVHRSARTHGVQLHRLIADVTATAQFLDRAAAVLADTPRASLWAAIELPEMASDSLVSMLAERIVRKRAHGFTTHLCVTEASAMGVDGRRQASRLARLGAFRSAAIGAHLSVAADSDLAVLRRAGVAAAHCPSATMFGGGGGSVAGRLRDAGMTVTLGLDNASLNSVADMGEEIRRALAFDRMSGTGVAAIDARAMLRMATIDGARAVGHEAEIGSLEVGKRADLVVVRADGAHWQPSGSITDQLIMRRRIDDVVWVLVDGEPVLSTAPR